MRGYDHLGRLLFMLVISSYVISVAHGQYWFQSGAAGTYASSQNQGASISIQTIYQNVSVGSLGFWIGEDISNGAFIQAGYEITNSTGYYPTTCSLSGCVGSTYITAGTPTWFWEYFPANYEGQSFLGGIGPDGSAGVNGTYHTYAFKSTGTTWTAYFDNQSIGSVNLGATSSGANPPSALGEVADASGNTQAMQIVAFKNLKFFDGSVFKYAPEANAYAGYGKGSEEALPNTYGVREVNNLINYFAVGSGLSTPVGTKLWTLGYTLSVKSGYAGINSTNNYTAYSKVKISAPQVVNVSSGVREVFAGWSGTGAGSYSGSSNSVTLALNGNIEETALWQRQYYIGVQSTYDSVQGSGWYDANSTVFLDLNASIVNTGYGKRVVFDHWSTGSTAPGIKFSATAPQNVTLYWALQYLVNATSTYGNATGSGWYNANATASIRLTTPFVQTGNGTAVGFRQWSNGNSTANLTILVSQPTFISAIYGQKYLVVPVAEDAYGNALQGQVSYNVSGALIGGRGAYLFANKSYSVEYIYYKGAQVAVNHVFVPGGVGPVYFNTQVYNVTLTTMSLLGNKVNASVRLTFRNGSTFAGYTGAGGTLDFPQVPYGEINGTATYFGITEGLGTSKGLNAYMTFLTPLVLAIVVAGIIAIIASWRVSLEIHRRKGLID